MFKFFKKNKKINKKEESTYTIDPLFRHYQFLNKFNEKHRVMLREMDWNIALRYVNTVYNYIDIAYCGNVQYFVHGNKIYIEECVPLYDPKSFTPKKINGQLVRRILEECVLDYDIETGTFYTKEEITEILNTLMLSKDKLTKHNHLSAQVLTNIN